MSSSYCYRPFIQQRYDETLNHASGRLVRLEQDDADMGRAGLTSDQLTRRLTEVGPAH